MGHLRSPVCARLALNYAASGLKLLKLVGNCDLTD